MEISLSTGAPPTKKSSIALLDRPNGILGVSRQESIVMSRRTNDDVLVVRSSGAQNVGAVRA
jgi:hypothetical protein